MPQSQDPYYFFPPEHQQPIQGLLMLGHIEETFSLCGHTFTLRTLRMSEELEAELVAKEYLDSMGQVKAYSWAHAAAALVAVDGDPNFCPNLSDNLRTNIRGKFNFITSNWYWPVGDWLFKQYQTLLLQQKQAIDAIENLSNRSLSNFLPSSDSLESGDSSQENSPISNDSA